MSEIKSMDAGRKTITWKMAVLFTIFSAAIITSGILVFVNQKERLFSEQETNLSVIAQLKINQIIMWHSDRLGDANSIMNNIPLVKSIEKFFKSDDAVTKRNLLSWMNSVRKEYDYRNILIADTSFYVRLASADNSSTYIPISDSIKKVINTHKVIMTDLIESERGEGVHMDILIPLMEHTKNTENVFGILILRIDPDLILFPLIQSWPTASKSSETLILEKEGDSLRYLNKLRHINNEPLRMMLGLENKRLLGVKAVSGIIGIAEGVDYRNVPVIGFLAQIPGFPWHMVAKVDREEILSPLRRYFFMIILITVLLILITATLFGIWIWNQKVTFLKTQLKNELAVKKSEEMFRKLFENMLNGFAYCKMVFEEGKPPDFIYITVNKTFEALTGLQDVIGKRVSEVIPGIQKNDPDLFSRLERVSQTGRPDVFETYLESLNMWFSISVYCPEKDYFIAVFDVITERKKAEDAIKESEKKFRQTFDLSPVGIVMVGMDKKFLLCNRSFSHSLGYEPEELKGKTISTVTCPADSDIGMSEMKRIAEGEITVAHVQKRYLHRDGKIVWGDVLISLIRNDLNIPQYFLAIIQDITESRRIVEALRESEDKFKYIFDHSVIGKSFTLPTGEINVNRAFCEMTGYSSEELVNMKWQNITHPDDVQFTEEMIAALLSGEKDFVRFVKRYIHKKGNVIWTDIGTSLRRDENGSPLYFMTNIIDITEQKKGEEMIIKLNEELEHKVMRRTELLEAANKELESFSYSVSHDLRAPLRSIHGYTKILMEEYDDKLDDEGKRICQIISSSAAQMGDLIDDLLNLSRIGRSAIHPGLVDMNSMVISVFNEITNDFEKSKINLKTSILHDASGDAKLIRLVWNNLISNAVKYTSKKNIPEISITSRLDKEAVVYSISDNGVGFNMKYKHKLFGVFQRLHSETEFEGNGVGLAIVQRIILKHGGKVWAEGKVGKGAVFYFTLQPENNA